MEIWKDIKGYEGKYQVSNLGNVKSLKRDKVMSPIVRRHGYFGVQLYDGKGKQKTYSIHRLVAQTFIDNPNNYAEVNHKDENKTNNCVDNLEWCTHKQNARYGTRGKRIGEKHTNNTWHSKRVAQHTLEGELIQEFPSLAQVKRELGFAQSAICNCARGKIYMAYGYTWKYL